MTCHCFSFVVTRMFKRSEGKQFRCLAFWANNRRVYQLYMRKLQTTLSLLLLWDRKHISQRYVYLLVEPDFAWRRPASAATHTAATWCRPSSTSSSPPWWRWWWRRGGGPGHTRSPPRCRCCRASSCCCGAACGSPLGSGAQSEAGDWACSWVRSGRT